jgi:hypothetical protein
MASCDQVSPVHKHCLLLLLHCLLLLLLLHCLLPCRSLHTVLGWSCSDAAVKVLRKVHPHTAALLRSTCAAGAASSSLA